MTVNVQYSQTKSDFYNVGKVCKKNLESKARRLANTKGLQLMKSRSRNQDAYEYGGFILADIVGNFVVAGAYPLAFSLTLEQVLEELEQR